MARYVYNGRMCHLYKNDRKLQKIIENYQIDRKLQNWQKITKINWQKITINDRKLPNWQKITKLTENYKKAKGVPGRASKC